MKTEVELIELPIGFRKKHTYTIKIKTQILGHEFCFPMDIHRESDNIDIAKRLKHLADMVENPHKYMH